MPDCEHAVILAFIVHDVGWITQLPELGLPAMATAIILQIYIVAVSHAEGGLELATQWSVLVWFVGNVIWTCCEYVWDESKPVGFLADVDFVNRLDPKLRPGAMEVAVALMGGTTVWLFVCHLTRWATVTRSRAAVVVDPRMPLVEAQHDEENPPEHHAFLRCLPLSVYSGLFVLPWLVMDTSWALKNLQEIWGYDDDGTLLVVSASAGVVAILLQADCIRRSFRFTRDKAALAAGELCWLTGNLVWMLQDLLTEDGCASAVSAAVVLFAIGMGFTVGAVVHGLRVCAGQLPSVEVRVENASSDEAAGAAALSAAREQRPWPAAASCSGAPRPPTLTAAAPPPASCTVKKRLRSRRGPSSLIRGVSVVPMRPPSEDPLRLAAGMALDELGNPPGPVLLMDLGAVATRLGQWRALLPQVRPYYALRSNADKKVAQLLLEGGCGFECVTTYEVRLALAVGARPEDILFSEPCKPRLHLQFAREKGVRLLSFGDAEELRRVAMEHPEAQLLLRLEQGGARRPLLGQFGAPREEWAVLLAAAAALQLEVVGVSLRAGGYGEDTDALEQALGDARQAFDLASALGFSMTVLSVGGELPCAREPDAPLAPLAAAFGPQLTQCFPEADFPGLRILAEPGRLLAGAAAVLLTKVVAGPAPGSYQLGADGSACLRAAFPGRPPAPEAVAPCGEALPCRLVGPAFDGSDELLREVDLPELPEGAWLLWRRAGHRGGAGPPGGSPGPLVWYYVREDCLLHWRTPALAQWGAAVGQG